MYNNMENLYLPTNHRKGIHNMLKLVLIIFLGINNWYGTAGYSKNILPQQTGKIEVTGTITDEQGEPLPGVNIVIKGSTTGVITNADGKYSIYVPNKQTVLIFTFIGYISQEIQVNNQRTLDIQLKEGTQKIEEVVVTAFATQKRVNVTGAISTVSGKDLVTRPVADITSALIGNTPGVSGLQATGEAGRAGTDIRIRGVATYGNATPLVVIDGIEQSAEQAFTELNAIDPNEILGISVLKDASSTAVYGIRAANGVIIVTTKRGRIGKPVVNLSLNYGFTKATQLQEGLSSYEWASMRNEAIMHEMKSFAGTDGLTAFLFDENDLWKMQNNRDFTPDEVAAMTHLSDAQKAQLNASPALYYGSRDLYKDLFGKHGSQWQANINVSGGTERVKYFTSFGYFKQNSITNAVNYHEANTGSKFERYNFRSNFDIDIIKNLKISINLAGQFGTTQGPGISGNDPYDLNGRYFTMMQMILEGNPLQCAGIVDGRLIQIFAGSRGSAQNPLSAKINDQKGGQNAVYNFLTSGTGYLYNTLLDSNIKLEYDMSSFVKGLKIQGTLSYQDDYNRYVTIKPTLPTYTIQRNLEDPNKLEFFGGGLGNDSFTSKGYSNWNKLYIDAGITYAGSFNNHNVSALFLGKASKYTMPNDNNHTPSGIIGLVGRVTYDYANRYMAEFNMGYNGTEQFAEGSRFGFFPAFSIGWVPTHEVFFPKNKWITFLKIRGSYGLVGNDLLGTTGRRYLYLPNTYNINQGGYWLGNSDGTSANPYYPGITEGAIGNPNITWEKAQKTDIGFESSFLNDRLSFTFDWFHEKRDNILTTLGIIPNIYGVPDYAVPPANVGETRNQGYEIVLGWNDKIGEVGYFLEGHLSYAKNKIIYKAEAPNPYDWMNATGKSIGQRFGLISDGFFNTQQELSNRPYNTFTSNKATLGDIRYKDLNGDGLIDNKDIAPIGYPNHAQYQYGIKLGFNYKGFDLSVLFNGTANGSFYLPEGFTIPYFQSGGNAWKWMYDGRWTPEKAATGKKITYPRATYNQTYSDNNFLVSDFWIISNNFFRLKNVEIGYTFPTQGHFLHMLKINSLRIYANGNNLFTFKNDLTDIGIDPETPDGSRNKYIFPLISTFNMGLKVQF